MRWRIAVVLWATLGLTAIAQAARVELYDRASGQYLPTYERDGRLYVAGEPGHEYEIRIHSDRAERMLAVTTVDGVNVITGETGATNQSGDVLDPYGFVRIEGWRKSLSHTAAFYFTKLPDSYAARTGRPDNVGVIGVALFHEKVRCCVLGENLRRQLDTGASAGASTNAPSAPSLERAESAARKAESKLGTGHGRSEYSAAEYTHFERASALPDETIAIYYDSKRNLIAQGVIPLRPTYAHRMPQPFPNGFVPDP